MDDPWGVNCDYPSDQTTVGNFEDNFVARDRLPDSKQYLDALEKKLARLKSGQTNDKDLLKALSETRDSHLGRLVDSDSATVLNDPDFDQPVTSSSLHRFIAPEKQANTISELFELIKYDQLGQVFEELDKVRDPEEVE